MTERFEDFRLVVAEIYFTVVEYPHLAQMIKWVNLDKIPDFPKLKLFLGNWLANNTSVRLLKVEIDSDSLRDGELDNVPPTRH